MHLGSSAAIETRGAARSGKPVGLSIIGWRGADMKLLDIARPLNAA
jgi:Asp-tRNA(Asn)/Glu-tRNA(Gln) amidotransferase A subunit family amidase